MGLSLYCLFSVLYYLVLFLVFSLQKGNSALHLLLSNPKVTDDMLLIPLQYGADINAQNSVMATENYFLQ